MSLKSFELQTSTPQDQRLGKSYLWFCAKVYFFLQTHLRLSQSYNWKAAVR